MNLWLAMQKIYHILMSNFDKIVCSSSLEHFNNDIRTLKEMNRVLKSHGKIVMTVDSFTYPISKELKEKHKRIAHVVNYYTPQSLEKRLKIAGITTKRNEYILNSPITSFFYKLGIKLKWSGKLWMIISFVAYPLCLISDRLFGMKNKGYTLIIEGEKGD